MYSNHERLGLFSRLDALLGSGFRERGYALEHVDGSFTITGDFRQFYIDAVSCDANAHLALDFIKDTAPDLFLEACELAEDDGFTLTEGHEVFMRNLPLGAHLDQLEARIH